MSCPHRRHVSVKPPDSVTHFERHQHGLQRWVVYWNWTVEDYHDTVASVAFYRAAVLDDLFADGGVIFAQQRYHIFGLGALGEAGKAS